MQDIDTCHYISILPGRRLITGLNAPVVWHSVGMHVMGRDGAGLFSLQFSGFCLQLYRVCVVTHVLSKKAYI